VVSFDVPYPPDYGGVIDVFYKLKALSEAGVRVHLHCFDYGRGHHKALHDICESVHYYSRRTRKTLLFHRLPFIVVSRRNQQLLTSLLKDDHPILFEGLHSCYYLNHPGLAKRLRLVRTHNVEHEYYLALARAEQNSFKKAYFGRETLKLSAFESVLRSANHVLAISPNDFQHFNRRYGNAVYVPAFHPDSEGFYKEKKDRIALYHGNLAVAENDNAARFLTEEVFSQSDYPLVIAGNNPSKELEMAVNERANVTLQQNVSTDQIRELVRKAWINILPTFQNTGIKLKLLFALYNGGYCMVNSPMVQDTGLEEFCVVKDTPEEMAEAMEALMRLPFSESEFKARVHRMNETFSNARNAAKITDLLDERVTG
jgi:hypothetical protein